MTEANYQQNWKNQSRSPKINEEHVAEWKKVGQELREIRESLRITQKQIAERIGCCTKVISRFEKGKKMKWRNVIDTGYRHAIQYLLLCRSKK